MRERVVKKFWIRNCCFFCNFVFSFVCNFCLFENFSLCGGGVFGDDLFVFVFGGEGELWFIFWFFCDFLFLFIAFV